MMSTETIQLILTALGPLSLGASIILFRMFRNMLKSTVFGWASEFKNLFLAEINEKPEIFDPVIAKFMARLAQPGSQPKTMKIFGFPVPPGLVDMITQYAAKKFLPQLAEGAENASSSPFG
jgi:hypothetical protein